jgi:hypothetical protein
MNRKLPVWHGQGERFGTFTRLISRTFFRWRLGGELQLISYQLILLLIGISIFKDYGISWDEPENRNLGVISFNYVFRGDKALLNSDIHFNGVTFDLTCATFEKVFGLTDTREIYLMRHLLNFLLFFTAVYFFYLLCKEYFNSWKTGLLGATFFVLSPRIFANAFYNDKDLVFLSFFVIGIYTLKKWLEEKSFSRTLLHAIVCGIIVDTRIVGVLIPAITVFILGLEFIFERKHKTIKNEVIQLVLYFVILAFFVILFWPALWNNPILNFLRFLKRASHLNIPVLNLFQGSYVSSLNVPWYFIPWWIIITTPILYSVLFFIGVFSLLLSVVRSKSKAALSDKMKMNGVVLLWFFIPLLMTTIAKSAHYDSWRHVFFIYPAFLIFSLMGLNYGYNLFIKRTIIKLLIISIVALSLLSTLFFMVTNHPHQDVYFNYLAGKGDNVRNNYDLDYWGLSNKEALEYILKNDDRSLIKIYDDNNIAIKSSYLFNEIDKKRLAFVNMNEADYFLTQYRWHKEDYNYPEYYSIKVDGIKIMTIYKLQCQKIQ